MQTTNKRHIHCLQREKISYEMFRLLSVQSRVQRENIFQARQSALVSHVKINFITYNFLFKTLHLMWIFLSCHSQNLVANASSCRKCSQPILDTVVTFKGGEYHDYCLVCNLCSKKLVGQSIYTDKQEKPYCIECFTKKEAKICNKCSKSIAPNQTNLVFEDKNFHKECFTCKKCSKQISSAESFYRDKEPDTFICEKCA